MRRYGQPIALILALLRQSDAQGGTPSALYQKVLVGCPIDNDIVTPDCHDWCAKGLELMHDDVIEGEGYYGVNVSVSA